MHLMTQLVGLITKQMPAELCFEWAHHASLDILLWILFAVYLSYDGVRAVLSDTELAWLQASMKMVVKRLRLNSFDEFLARLRRLPFATAWINLACTAYAWLDGSPLVTDHDPNPSSLFSLIRCVLHTYRLFHYVVYLLTFLSLHLRLNFDPMSTLDDL